MSRRHSAAACCVGALVLVGCGAATRGDARKPVPQRIQAGDETAVAHRTTLTAADLPTYHATPSPDGIWDPQSGSSALCLGVARMTPAAVSFSPMLTNNGGLSGGQLSSETATFASQTVAEHELTSLRSQRGPQCLAVSVRKYLAPAAADDDLTLSSSVQATPLPISISGHPRSFGYRMALAAQPRSESEQQFTVYADLIGFVTGPDVIELATYSSGQPFPPRVEQRLLDLLSRRARRLVSSGAP